MKTRIPGRSSGPLLSWVVAGFVCVISLFHGTSADAQSERRFSREEVEKASLVGKTEAEVLKRFGYPLFKRELQPGMEILQYSWPVKATGFAGFRVIMSHGVVVSWSPIETVVGPARDFQLLKPLLSTNTDVQSERRFSREEVEKASLIGKTEAEVVKRFGNPLLKRELQPGMEILQYSWPVEASGFSGFEVTVSHGVVVIWSPSETVVEPARDFQLLKPLLSTNSSPPKLRIYAVSESPIEGGRQVDTPSIAKLGYVAEKPDLEFARLKACAVSEGDGKPAAFKVAFSLEIPDEDAPALDSFSRKQIGQRVLIEVGGSMVSAPVLQTYILDGKFILPLADPRIQKEVETKLRQMLR